MALFYQPDISQGLHHLDEEESRHCVKVLRYSIGDSITILDGKGTVYEGKITEASPKKVAFDIVNSQYTEKPPHHIHIAIAPTKNLDRIEWFVEKAVEIGIQEVSFIYCKNSERKVLKTDRLERKAVSALKQSKGTYLPLINPLVALPSFTSTIKGEKFIAYVDFQNPEKLAKVIKPAQQYCVLIGPEGDFSPQELEICMAAGFKKVSLGNSRLRTETAGIVACHILNLANE